MEPSTSQVRYPINTVPLYSWALPNSTLPDEIRLQAHMSSELLHRLNYAYFPPDYGEAEEGVINQTERLLQDQMFRRHFVEFIK